MTLRFMSRTRLLLASCGLLALGACSSTSVRTFSSPSEATAAMVTAAESGDMDEASRIFDGYARSSVSRDRVYAQLFDAAESRYESGQPMNAANLLRFVSGRYPNAIAAREALVYALFLERVDRGAPDDQLRRDLEAAISEVRAKAPRPANWVDLAATQASIDAGDMESARATFASFLGVWEGSPASLMPYVEDLDRYLQSH